MNDCFEKRNQKFKESKNNYYDERESFILSLRKKKIKEIMNNRRFKSTGSELEIQPNTIDLSTFTPVEYQNIVDF